MNTCEWIESSDNYWLKEHKKPLFRWTVGPCIKQGFDILRESVFQALKIYGNRFKFIICHNNLSENQKSILKSIAIGNVGLYEQDWEDCPLPIDYQCLRQVDGEFPIGTLHCNGSIWKYCPDRMRPHGHEFICDNDLIITSPLDEIENFLSSTKKALLLQDRFSYYGRYTVSHAKLLNTGLIGLPPSYDLKHSMLNIWSQHKYPDITQADEQGLAAATLSNDFGSSLIVTNSILQVLAKDSNSNESYGSYNSYGSYDSRGFYHSSRSINSITENERINMMSDASKGFHFCQANKIDNHVGWSWYVKKNKVGVE